MHPITVALCASSLLPHTPRCHCCCRPAPCHCCPLHLIIVAPCASLLSPHTSHCCRRLLCWCRTVHPIGVTLCALSVSPVRPIVIAPCASSLSPRAPCRHCPTHLIAVALCTSLPLAPRTSLPSPHAPRCHVSHSKFFRMPWVEVAGNLGWNAERYP